MSKIDRWLNKVLATTRGRRLFITITCTMAVGCICTLRAIRDGINILESFGFTIFAATIFWLTTGYTERLRKQ